MEVENIGIPVILQDLDLSGKSERNSISVIPHELEPDGGDIRMNSSASIPQEIEPNGGGDIRRNSIPVIPEEMKSNGDDMNSVVVLPQEIAVIPQEIEPYGSRQNSMPAILPEMEPKGGDIGRNSIEKVDLPSGIKMNSIPVIPQDMEHHGGHARRNSIAAIPQDIKPNDSGIRRSSFPGTPQEMEPKGSDTRRNYILVIPHGDDIRKSSTGVKIRSRYLKAPLGSCHDYCKFGERHGSQENATTVMPKSDTTTGSAGQSLEKLDNSFVKEKKVLSLTDKETFSSKKVSSSFKGIDVSMEDSTDLKVRPVQLEPSSLPGSALSNSKLISTTGTRSFPDSQTRKLNTLVATEKKVSSSTKRETVSLKKVSAPKEIDVCKEELIDMKAKDDQLESSSLLGSFLSLSNSKVISAIGPTPSPDYEMQNSVVTEKKVLSPFKDINVSMEDSIIPKVEKLGPSSLSGSFAGPSNSKVISTISPKTSSDSETQKLKSLVKRVLSLKKKETLSSKKVSTATKEVDISTKGSIGSKVRPQKFESSSLLGQGSSNQGKSGTRKGKEIPENSSSRVNRKLRSKNPRTSVLDEKKILEAETVSLTSKHPIKRAYDVNTGSSKNLQGQLSHLKHQKNTRKVEPEGPCYKDMPEKILYVIESNNENIVEPTSNGVSVPELSSSSPLSFEGKRLKQGRKGITTTRSPSFSEKKSLKHTVKGGYVRSPAPLQAENKGLRRSIQRSLSTPSSPSSSVPTSPTESTHDKANGATSLGNTMKADIEKVNLKVERKTWLRRSGILSSESKNNSPRKLTFKSGRVIDLKPEISTPRRLKFRRVRLLGEVESSKGSIKNGSTAGKEVDGSQSNGAGIKRGGARRKEGDDSQLNGAGTKRGSARRKEVGYSQSNGVGIKRGSARRKDVDDRQLRGAGIKRGSARTKEADGHQSDSAAIKMFSSRLKEGNNNQSNGAKIKGEKVVLRNEESDVEDFQRTSLRRMSDSVLLSGTNAGPEKVVLRHQDVKGRKDIRKLLNNVIEETASRLVQSRKSKVKALVGAFETVISLQDSKPSAREDSC